MAIFRVVLCLVIVSSLAACAFGDRDVVLSYPPDTKSNDSLVGSAEAAPIVADAGTKLTVLLFDDLRADKSTVGEVRNGWGMKTADANTSSDVPEWVRNAITFEFKQAGFEVLSEMSADAENQIVLDGQIVNAFCTALFSYEAKVSFIAKLIRDGETLLDTGYNGEGSIGNGVTGLNCHADIPPSGRLSGGHGFRNGRKKFGRVNRFGHVLCCTLA